MCILGKERHLSVRVSICLYVWTATYFTFNTLSDNTSILVRSLQRSKDNINYITIVTSPPHYGKFDIFFGIN